MNLASLYGHIGFSSREIKKTSGWYLKKLLRK